MSLYHSPLHFLLWFSHQMEACFFILIVTIFNFRSSCISLYTNTHSIVWSQSKNSYGCNITLKYWISTLISLILKNSHCEWLFVVDEESILKFSSSYLIHSTSNRAWWTSRVSFRCWRAITKWFSSLLKQNNILVSRSNNRKVIFWEWLLAHLKIPFLLILSLKLNLGYRN